MRSRIPYFILKMTVYGRVLFIFILLILSGAGLNSVCSAKFSRVISYPAVAGDKKSGLYSVSVNRIGVFTERYKDVHCACFAFTGQADITVTSNSRIESYSISPEGYNISSGVQGDTLSFSIAGPRKLVVRINGGERLFVIADAIEDNSPVPGDPGVVNVADFGVDSTGAAVETEKIQKAIDSVEKNGILYLSPGIYMTGTVYLKSDMTVYLCYGAVLKGAPDYTYYPSDKIGRRLVMIADCANVSIKGRGIIDGNGAAVRSSGEKAHLVTLKNSGNILIEGVFLRESGSWNTHILYCDGVTVRNVKMINDVSLSNTDGFDPDSSSDVLIEDCFVYAGDDAFAVKTSGKGGLLRDLKNNIIRNNVVLTQKSALKIGTETRAARMSNIRFINNHVIQSDRGMAIYCNDGADISDIRFVGNRFEDNYPDSKKRMIHFQISDRAGAGLIRDILIKDCSFNRPFPQSSTFEGLDPDHKISGVLFENFSIAGKFCRNAGEAHLDTDGFVENIIFRVSR